MILRRNLSHPSVPSLRSMITSYAILMIYQRMMSACTFADLLSANGDWDIGKLSTTFTAEAISHIISVKSPDPNDTEDVIIWRWSKRHNFEVSSAYSHIFASPWDDKDQIWDLIWKNMVPQRVCLFLWLTCRQRLMTNSERCRRGLGTSAVCPRCHMADESVLHTLRDCVELKAAWMQLLAPGMREVFFQLDLHSWLRCNLSSHVALPGDDIPWRILFASLLWQLWKNQNDLVFNNLSAPTKSLVNKSLALARYYNEPLKQSSSLVHRVEQNHVWPRPPKCWVTKIIWTPRDANKLADRLAKCVNSHLFDVLTLDEPPDYLQPILAADISALHS
ncbi:hypothetical protein V6N11_045214 [Hibiscus sabdariffa]|uniref:Reverse transcriptase zinc-binding domain-containing protein n=1 Tax=Hibiscus sabdariffa TaxID=183260 RepID=A0ABR2NEP4_9ROSI